MVTVQNPHKGQVGEGISTLVLLAFLLLSVTGSIEAANWADGLNILTWAALGGLALGLLLARLPVRGWVAHPFMLVTGVVSTALFASTLLPDVMTLQEKLIVLQERFFVWISKATFGGVSTDNLMFVVQIAFFTWIMAYVAAWYVYRRHQVWGAILPTGVALLFNLFYALPQNGLYFTLYILCALVLIVRLNLRYMEQWWRQGAVGYAGDINFDFLTYGVGFSLVLMILAWMLPAAAPGPSWFFFLGPLQTPWQQAEDQFNRVFSSLRAVARPAPSTFFGASLNMGGPVNLGVRPVMDIKAPTGRYWRATVYDKYTGIGWIDTHNSILNLVAEDPRLADNNPDLGRVAITQTVKVYLPDQNILYAQSQPIFFSVPVELRYGQPSTSDESNPVPDVATVRSRNPLREGDTYSVVSAVSVADEDSLRGASTNYSSWINSTYLQLPDVLPKRVQELARQITSKYDNPYDRATAIETYLRTHIKYNDNVSAPPQGRDGVDYTLFDRPEGYCNYYASAMVVLARSIGIPARVASGYSLGNYSDGVFHIVEANAHSWAEVYFPGYGWIEFEPTASKPQIERPKKSAYNSADSANDPSEFSPSRRKFPNKDLVDEGDLGSGGAIDPFGSSIWNERNATLAGSGLVALIAIGAVTALQWRRARRFATLAPAARLYERLQERARWLGVPEATHATPFERARAIGDALPDARGDVELATSLYVREKFGALPLNQSERDSLGSAWARMRAAWWRGLAVRVLHRVIDPPHRFFERTGRAIERWGKG